MVASEPLIEFRNVHRRFGTQEVLRDVSFTIHRGESVGALFSSEVSFTQEMTFWEGGEQHTVDAPGDKDPERDAAADGDRSPPALAATPGARPS